MKNVTTLLFISFFAISAHAGVASISIIPKEKQDQLGWKKVTISSEKIGKIVFTSKVSKQSKLKFGLAKQIENDILQAIWDLQYKTKTTVKTCEKLAVLEVQSTEDKFTVCANDPNHSGRLASLIAKIDKLENSKMK